MRRMDTRVWGVAVSDMRTRTSAEACVALCDNRPAASR